MILLIAYPIPVLLGIVALCYLISRPSEDDIRHEKWCKEMKDIINHRKK